MLKVWSRPAITAEFAVPNESAWTLGVSDRCILGPSSPSLSVVATPERSEPEQLPEPHFVGARICKVGPRFLQG